MIGSINQELPALAPKPPAEGPGFKHLLQEQIDKVNQLQRDATEAIEDLAEDYREVLVLRHWGRLSYEEIARITGSTVPAVESRLFRARKALKKRLGGLNPGMDHGV